MVSPTTSTKFCEGASAQFSATSIVGNPILYQWSLKKTTESTYSNLVESSHFVGVNTSLLNVYQIGTTESAYKIAVNFNNCCKILLGNP